MKKWTRAWYQPNLPLREREYVTACEEHIRLSAEAAGEGMVLLKNDDGILPLKTGAKVALFGKGSFDYVKGGGGSGDVFTLYERNLPDGLTMEGAQVFAPLSDYYKTYVEGCYAEGNVPGMIAEPDLPGELVKKASEFTDTALVVISRFSGEGWDRTGVALQTKDNPFTEEDSLSARAGKIFPDGDFYLTSQEKDMIGAVKDRFARVVVVLNTGGMMETDWIKADPGIQAALLAWQGGMEGGLAAARILMGKTCPSGRLPDTFARSLEDYPSTQTFTQSSTYVRYTEDIYVGYRYFETIPGALDKVVYPFGYGLSYTTFDRQILSASRNGADVVIRVKVTNTGEASGKEVVQLYYSAPSGKLGKPARELGAFAKTRVLAPGESEEITLTVTKYQLSSYDDLGKVQKSAYVLEKGSYGFLLGGSVRDAVPMEFTWEQEEDETVQQLEARMVPSGLEKRLCADGSYEALPEGNKALQESVPAGLPEVDMNAAFPAVRGHGRDYLLHPMTEGKPSLLDVAEGRKTLDELLSALSDDDLIWLTGGRENKGVANTCGFGGLPEYGIPAVMTADGPAGIRLKPECGVHTTAWPCETLLASTWNTELVGQVGKAAGEELKENNLQVWLAPAVNIHRNPLCGRNFEYLSEDPYLAGKIGAAHVRGIQENKVACSVKHFACNNKETNRRNSNSMVSERALREIYLKAFEIIVKEADPWTMMTSYNLVNGQRSSESRELLTDILRGEWGFQGMLTTDWWNLGDQYKEILAGNDVKMATGHDERVKAALEAGAIGRKDLESCAGRILEMILKLD